MKINYIFQLSNEMINNIKIHFAIGIPNRETPLLEFYNNKFQQWQEWQTKKNFEREYILSLIYYKPGEWIFSGIYKSISVEYRDDAQCYKYSTELTPLGEELIGKMIIAYKKEYRQSYVYFENYINELEIIELLRDKVSILPFPGYENVNLCFKELFSIIDNNVDTWKTALSSVKGVYIITDNTNGKHYIGSAYGEESFWQRWSNYIYSKHGFNEGLKKLLADHGEDYVDNFHFAILEIRSNLADKNEILKRESYWKTVFLTRYNEN
nr:GIY-YIG nuclease family protein [Leptospira interrogans]